MIKTHEKSEKGQAIIMIVIGFVVILGFVGLAIDAGMVYSDRRNAQNSADAAALAGGAAAALYLENNHVNTDNWGNCTNGSISGAQIEALIKAQDRATSNNFNIRNDGLTTGGNYVIAPCTGNGNDQYIDVTVHISTTTKTNFVQFIIGNGGLQSQVEAVSRVAPHMVTMADFSLVTLSNCSATGDDSVNAAGGGNSGGVDTYQGGIFINSTGGSCCALSPGTSHNAGFIQVHDNFNINNVGTCSYSGQDKIVPSPVVTGYNGGQPLLDPLANLPEPSCPVNGTKDAFGHYNPGNYGGPGQLTLGAGIFNPGVYCITGDVSLSGQSSIDASSGVLLFFKNGSMQFRGQGGINLVAPTEGNCSGLACQYAGMAIYSARGNTSTIEVRGNGGTAVQGTIYVPSGLLMARGGGSVDDETNIYGQVITNQVDNRGNGSLKVTYSAPYTYQAPSNISMER